MALRKFPNPVLHEENPLSDPVEPVSHENDHRLFGDYASRYKASAWIQIIIELIILVIYVGLALVGVAKGIEIANTNVVPDGDAFAREIAVTMPWGAMFFAALAGGSIFATKWLYHSVAKAEWNRDRIIWRFIAPINSAVLATAAGFGISAGIMPFLDQNSFRNLYTALFFGFFIGYFSDNVLAALQRLARKWFGTLDHSGSEASQPDEIVSV